MKQCNKCKQIKQLSEFGFKSKIKEKYHSFCKECHNSYSKEHYIDNKESYIQKARKNNNKLYLEHRELIEKIKSIGCKYCNEKDSCCLDFHHISDNKEHNVSRMIREGYSKNKVLEEISKCEVVCANCHRKIHAGKL